MALVIEMKETTEQRNRYQNSLAAQYLGLRAFTGEAWVQFLARDPRFNKLCSRAKKKKKKQISSLFLGGYNQVSWQTLIKPSSKKIEFQMWYVWRKNFQCCEKVTRVWNQAFDIHGSGEKNVSQSRLILCDPIDSRLPGSLVHGILQARTLEWVAIPF